MNKAVFNKIILVPHNDFPAKPELIMQVKEAFDAYLLALDKGYEPVLTSATMLKPGDVPADTFIVYTCPSQQAISGRMHLVVYPPGSILIEAAAYAPGSGIARENCIVNCTWDKGVNKDGRDTLRCLSNILSITGLLPQPLSQQLFNTVNLPVMQEQPSNTVNLPVMQEQPFNPFNLLVLFAAAGLVFVVVGCVFLDPFVFALSFFVAAVTAFVAIHVFDQSAATSDNALASFNPMSSLGGSGPNASRDPLANAPTVFGTPTDSGLSARTKMDPDDKISERRLVI